MTALPPAGPWPPDAVDAIAEQLSADYDSQRAWVKGDEVYREAWRVDARVLLGLPAVVRALTEARADGWDEGQQATHDHWVSVMDGPWTPAPNNPHLRASIRHTDERNDR